MNRIGVQFQIDDGEMLRYNREVKPRSWKSIHVLKREFLEELHADNPDALGILRLYPNSDWRPEPERRAEEHIKRIQAEAGHVLNLFGAVEDNNEYIHAHHDDEMVQDADRYMERFIQLCEAELGLKPVVLNAATGNWGDDIARFPRMLLALQRYGGFLGFHEYDWPTLWRTHEEGIAAGNEGMWQALRWKRAARASREFLDGWAPQFIITEAGLERAVVEGEDHGGWKLVYPGDVARCSQNYAESLKWYNSQLDGDVHSVILFGCGMVKPWDGWGFDIGGMSSLYDAIKALPEPQNGGETVRVFDRDGVELFGSDAEQMVAKYRLVISVPELKAGDRYYDLVALREKTGDSAFIYCVQDAAGNPVVNPDETLDLQLTHRAFWWPDMGDANDIQSPFATDREATADLGGLNENGEGGSGMGPGAYFHPDDPEHPVGPHRAWVRHPVIKSVELQQIGMLAGENHDHMDGEWQEKVHEGEEPPPPTGELVPELIAKVEEPHDSMMLGIAVIVPEDDEAVKEWLWNTRGLLTGPGAYDVTDPHDEWSYLGQRTHLAEGCCDYGSSNEDEEREYLKLLFRLPDMTTPLIGPHSLMVKPMDQEQKRRVVYVYRLVEKSEPPPPPPDDPRVRLLQIINEVRGKLVEIEDIANGLGMGAPTRLKLTWADESSVEYTVSEVKASRLGRIWAALLGRQ